MTTEEIKTLNYLAIQFPSTANTNKEPKVLCVEGQFNNLCHPNQSNSWKSASYFVSYRSLACLRHFGTGEGKHLNRASLVEKWVKHSDILTNPGLLASRCPHLSPLPTFTFNSLWPTSISTIMVLIALVKLIICGALLKQMPGFCYDSLHKYPFL